MSAQPAQPALFQHKTCTARGCDAGDRKNLCKWAADIAHGVTDPYTPKPKTCLHRLDPADGQVPY